MSEDRLKQVVKENLDEVTCPLKFEEVWKKARQSETKKREIGMKKMKKMIVVAATLLLAVGTGATGVFVMRTDDMSYTFKNDEHVLGEWKTVDFVDSKKDFDPEDTKNSDLLFVRGLDFEMGGRLETFVQQVGQDMFVNEVYNGWTQGSIYHYWNETKPSYEIKEIDDKEYLFYEWKSGDYNYSLFESNPYYVLERGTPTERNLEGRVMDDVSYTFVNDEALLGAWQLVDIVDTKESFNASTKQFKGKIELTGLEFHPEGEIITVIGKTRAPVFPGKWTKGSIINEGEKLRLEYEIIEIGGKDYLFYEQKGEEYVLGLIEEVPYYVFERVEE